MKLQNIHEARYHDRINIINEPPISGDDVDKIIQSGDEAINKIAPHILGNVSVIASGQQSSSVKHPAYYTTLKVDTSLDRTTIRTFVRALKSVFGPMFDRIGYLPGDEQLTVIYRPTKSKQ